MGGYASTVKDDAKRAIHTQMMLHREVQMAVNIAKARDMLQWWGGFYCAGVTGLAVASVAGKALPKIAVVPLIVGGFMLTNMADLAYGSKMHRVQREAERIMTDERSVFVPPSQAPFAYLYDQEASLVADVPAVSTLWPPFVPFSRSSAPSPSSGEP